jgi:hypothetical protein
LIDQKFGKFSAGAIAMIVVSCLLGCIVLGGTGIDMYTEYVRREAERANKAKKIEALALLGEEPEITTSTSDPETPQR